MNMKDMMGKMMGNTSKEEMKSIRGCQIRKTT